MSGLQNNKNEKRIYSLIGLAQKAGSVKAGEFQTEKYVKSGQANLIIVAGDASDNTKKKFRNMAEFYKVPFFTFGNRDNLGNSIGCEFRASLAILNKGLADKIIDELTQFGGNLQDGQN